MNDQIKAGAEIHAGDGGYSIGTREKYEEFVKIRSQSWVSDQSEHCPACGLEWSGTSCGLDDCGWVTGGDE